MSVKELVLQSAIFDFKITVDKTDNGNIIIGRYILDRNQAHLLMLYLQEHLK